MVVIESLHNESEHAVGLWLRCMTQALPVATRNRCSFVALLNDVVLDAAGRGIGKPVQAKHSIRPMQHGEPKKLHDVVDDVSTGLAACFAKLGVHFVNYKPVGLMT